MRWQMLLTAGCSVVAALAAASPFARYAADSPVVVVVFGRTDNRWSPYDCALASGNLLVAAAGFGLKSTYCGLDPERDEAVRELFAIPDDYFVHALIPLGHPDEDKEPHTKYNPALIHWEKYDLAQRETVIKH
jgi:nitroreductase